MDAHGNYQSRKNLPKVNSLEKVEFLSSTWTLNCKPVCFANGLSQHVVANKEKVIQWGHLNSGSACTL